MELPEEAQRAPSPPPIEPRKPPTTPAELEEFLLGPEQGLARALAGRVNPGYHRSGSTYVSSTKKDYDDPSKRNEPVEAVDKTHFHSRDDVGKHGARPTRAPRPRACPSALTRAPLTWRSRGDGALRGAAQGAGAQEAVSGVARAPV